MRIEAMPVRDASAVTDASSPLRETCVNLHLGFKFALMDPIASGRAHD